MKMFYPFQLTWTSAFGVTYLSVLALYIRVFPNTWLRKWSIYSGIVAILFEVSTLGWLIFQCTPIRFFWDKSKPGHCINQSQTYVITSAMVAIMIVWLYLLPIPAVWSLQLSKGRKYGLAVTFSVGALSVLPSHGIRGRMLIDWQCRRYQRCSNRISRETGLFRCHMVRCPGASLEQPRSHGRSCQRLYPIYDAVSDGFLR